MQEVSQTESNYEKKNAGTSGKPHWQQRVSEILQTGESSVILLHGNVKDFQPYNNEYLKLQDFIFQNILPSRDYKFFYDPHAGIQFPAKEQREAFFASLRGYDAYHKTSFAENPPKQPGPAFSLIENITKLQVMDKKSVVAVINYLEHLTPITASSGNINSELRYMLVAIDKWAQNPQFINNDVTFFLIAENLARIDEMITRNPYIHTVYIPHPDEQQRTGFYQHAKKKWQVLSEIDDNSAGALTAGLNLMQLSRLMAYLSANKQALTLERLKELKKQYIEAEVNGLLEFVEPKYTLEYVAGHTVAKKMLKDAASAVSEGMTDYLPMGYLVSGPVGTGKTFLVTCFAGEVGIPVVKFRNFRSQYVGSTEANLETILNLLKAVNPVVVMIDEADAFLGDRNQGGDSGTSNRVFASLISFMGDTSYRGKILWFLMTSRPDLLPIDVKRQGRAEEHISLFHPQNKEEENALFQALAKKNKIAVDDLDFSKAKTNSDTVSGADIEAILVRAAMQSQLRKEDKLSQEVLNETAQSFQSPNYPLETELQILVAIRESTNRKLLPEKFSKDSSSDITARINELLNLLRER